MPIPFLKILNWINVSTSNNGLIWTEHSSLQNLNHEPIIPYSNGEVTSRMHSLP